MTLAFRREWQIMARSPWLWGRSVLFWSLSLLIGALCLGGGHGAFAGHGPAWIWSVLVFLNFVAAEGLFDNDVRSGLIDHWILSPVSLVWVWFARALRHWLLSGFVIVSTLPLSLIVLGVPLASSPGSSLSGVWIGLGVGSICLSLISTFGAALTVGLRTVSLPIFAVPLMVPALILGIEAQNPRFMVPNVLWLLALLCVLLGTLGLAGARTLRLHAEHR